MPEIQPDKKQFREGTANLVLVRLEDKLAEDGILVPPGMKIRRIPGQHHYHELDKQLGTPEPSTIYLAHVREGVMYFDRETAHRVFEPFDSVVVREHYNLDSEGEIDLDVMVKVYGDYQGSFK